ncbi:MAG TPA: penicillin-binding transpeptidase domain-containing protein [Bryobacteraceae bacterium]|nr:penicillin-binding transpeptidase domain-containing protein [Bryobacteraceae bacterium]
MIWRSLLGIAALLAPLRASDLQDAADAAMRGYTGAAVVMEVASGRLLAQVHPEVAARRLARPGSAVKPFTLQALQERGRAQAVLVCGRKLTLGDREMDCTHPVLAGPLDAVAALAYSCNFYFSTLAAGLRGPDLVEALTRAGLTARTGLSASEAVGEILPPQSAAQRQLLALGEANIRVTPLGLLWAYRKMALHERTIASEGLEAAAAYGTARLAAPRGVKIAGKTGTASDPGSGRIHAWFAGYGPAGTPRIAVVVFLEQGGGGRDAAPIARKLFEAALPAP